MTLKIEPKRLRTAIANWMREGHIQFIETTEVGIESAPKALISVLTGGNLGKTTHTPTNIDSEKLLGSPKQEFPSFFFTDCFSIESNYVSSSICFIPEIR